MGKKANQIDDDREEGEIVEDEFEDVSDCSMASGSPLCSGKSLYPAELLRSVSLSSISEGEYDRKRCKKFRPARITIPPRKDANRKQPYLSRSQTYNRQCQNVYYKGIRRTKHRKFVSAESSSEGEDEKLDRRMLRQLKEAVRIDTSHELLHNSLRTRLRVMIEPDSNMLLSDEDPEISALRDLALLSKEKENKYVTSDKVEVTGSNGSTTANISLIPEECFDEHTEDKELSELRIAALKSAIMKKHQDRKKRKALQDYKDNTASSTENLNSLVPCVKNNSDINKENTLCISVLENENNLELHKSSTKVESVESTKYSENDALNHSLPHEMLQQDSTQNLNVHNETEISKNVQVNNCTSVHNLSSNISTEEDEDIMRAMLLASMSKKITAANDVTTLVKSNNEPFICNVIQDSLVVPSLKITLTKPVVHTVKNDLRNRPIRVPNNTRRQNFKSMSTMRLVNIKKSFEKPIVKPLIINLNEDSDSDTDLTKVPENILLKETVTNFLKKQRAEVEAKTELNASPLPKKDVDESLLDKSVVKLLPRSQQIEYRKLKQQLINARKKPRVKKLSQKLSDNKLENNLLYSPRFKKINRGKVEGSKSNVFFKEPKMYSSFRSARNIVEKKLTQMEKLQKTLNDLQVNKNSRLQMKGKYQELVPLLRKINQASSEKRQNETEIKRLLSELEKTRNRLATSHQTFITLVEQLLTDKENIDRRCTSECDTPDGPPLAKVPKHCTSTPNKVAIIKDMCDISKVEVVIGVDKTAPVQIIPEKQQDIQQTVESTEEMQLHNVVPEMYVEKCPERDVLLEPDVNKIFVEQPDTKSTVPNYVSPLDHRNSEACVDPLAMLCPYDLLGVCKDKECPHKHYS